MAFSGSVHRKVSRRTDRILVMSSVPIPKFGSWCGNLVCELRNRKDTNAHFPKFVLHRCTHSHELRKVVGTRKHIDSSAAFLSEVPGSNSPPVVQELQIGGISLAAWGRRERYAAPAGCGERRSACALRPGRSFQRRSSPVGC